MMQSFLGSYQDLINGFLKNGYVADSFRAATAEQRERRSIIRHDIDFDCGYAYEIARAERELGVRWNHFFLLRSDSCNLLSPENSAYVERIRDDGHAVSLHFDPTLYGADFLEGFRREREIFENIFKVKIEIISDTFLFSINGADTAETLHFKNTLAMRHLIRKNLARILAGKLELKRQPEITPTYYPKRRPSDSLIDWSRDIFYLERHIRAVTRPFNGAYTFTEGRKVVIYRAALFGYGEESARTVVEVFPNGKFLVKCLGGLLIVHEYESSLPVKRGDRFGNHDEAVHYFELNNFGYYDLANG